MRTDPKRLERGHLASRRSDLQAALIGLLLAGLVAVAGWWVTLQIQRAQTDVLEIRTEVLGASVARAVGRTVERALDYGIPFDQLNGVTDYLEEVLEANPELARVEVRSRDGWHTFVVERQERHARGEDEAPIEYTTVIYKEDTRVGDVTLVAAGAVIASVQRHQLTLVLACALAAGLVGAAVMRVFLAEHWDLPRGHVMANLGAMARGVFAEASKIRRASPLGRLARSGQEAREPVHTLAREVAFLEDELRSIDIDGSLGTRVDKAVDGALQRYRFEQQARPGDDRWWAGWWNLLLLVAGTMTLPLIGGFAADRVGFGDDASAAAAAVLALEALGGLLGLVAARRLPLHRFRILLVLVPTLLASAATIAVAEVRDLLPFLALRFATGFCIWFVVASIVLTPGYSQRGPWYCALLLLFGLVLGPLMGVLLADGLGRRAAFVATGLALLLAGLTLALRQPNLRRLSRQERGSWPQALGFAASLSACSGLIAFDIGSVEDRHDYAAVAAAIGLLGSGLGLGLVLRHAIVAPLALVAATVVIWLPHSHDSLVAVMSGFLGLSIGAQITRGWRPGEPAGLAAALSGLGLGPALAVGAIHLGLTTETWLTLLFLIPLGFTVWGRRAAVDRRASGGSPHAA
ncbi:MAG: hypothetical protein Kilf2KO_02680 [Rhodospirillales bacterium]